GPQLAVAQVAGEGGVVDPGRPAHPLRGSPCGGQVGPVTICPLRPGRARVGPGAIGRQGTAAAGAESDTLVRIHSALGTNHGFGPPVVSTRDCLWRHPSPTETLSCARG